jgi:hypothetical protein
MMSINENIPRINKKPKTAPSGGGGGSTDLPKVQRKTLTVTLRDWPNASIAAGASTEQTWFLSMQKILAAVGYTVTEDDLTARRDLQNARLRPTPYTLSAYHMRSGVNVNQHKADVENVRFAFGSKYGLQTGGRTGENVACIRVDAEMHNISSSSFTPANTINAAQVENLYIEIIVDTIVAADASTVATNFSSGTNTLAC